MPVLAPTLTKLEVTFTNQPARRPDGHNLWIAVNVNLTKLTALFHCQPPEHVGAHSGRMVTYRADHDSVLRFTDRVFKYDHVQLIAQKETVLSVRERHQQHPGRLRNMVRNRQRHGRTPPFPSPRPIPTSSSRDDEKMSPAARSGFLVRMLFTRLRAVSRHQSPSC
jgi:hypothetical protein